VTIRRFSSSMSSCFLESSSPMLCIVLPIPYTTCSAGLNRQWAWSMTGWNSRRQTWTTTHSHSLTVLQCLAAASGTTGAIFSHPQPSSRPGIIAVRTHGKPWILFAWWSNCSESAHSPLLRHPSDMRIVNRILDPCMSIADSLCLSVTNFTVVLHIVPCTFVGRMRSTVGCTTSCRSAQV